MSLVEPVEPVAAAELGRVHFVGIGGAGMSGIARILLQRGVAVSGSDAKDSGVLRGLREAGARVHVGHRADQLGEADTLVVSSAIRPDNPELRAARDRGLRILPRAAALGGLLLGRRGVAVAGTHGKTTTTSMLTVILRELGAEPGYVIGGTLAATGSGAADGTGDVIVVEADESDGSFLMLSPAVAVITNIEADHLDNYGGLDEIYASFARFADRVGETLITAEDDPGARKIAEAAGASGRDGRRVRTFGLSAGADYRVSDVAAEGFATRFTLTASGQAPQACVVAAPGEHNVLNAAAALAAADALGCDLAQAAAALARFTGSGRRMELKGEGRGVRVYDSYAHHPTEVAADLRAVRAALRSAAGSSGREGRIVVLFQPHLYSRTRAFAAEFAEALSLADAAVVLPIYAAREDPEPGVTTELITGDAGTGGRVHGHAERATAAAHVAGLAQAGDVVLTMGAGDVTELGPEIVAALAEAP